MLPFVLATVGCLVAKDTDAGPLDTSADSAADTDSAGDTADSDGTLTIETELTAEGIRISISGTGEGVWRIGLVRTGVEDPWTGEDCWQGDTVDGESYAYCHEYDPTSGTMTLRCGDLPLDNDETLLCPDMEGEAGVYAQAPSGACYTGWEAGGWWAALGCTEIPFP
jgi:hypothetical protein